MHRLNYIDYESSRPLLSRLMYHKHQFLQNKHNIIMHSGGLLYCLFVAYTVANVTRSMQTIGRGLSVLADNGTRTFHNVFEPISALHSSDEPW